MKNLFLIVFLSFAVVCYYLNKNYWSKVTDPDYSSNEQLDTSEFTSPPPESKLTEIIKLPLDTGKTALQNKPAL